MTKGRPRALDVERSLPVIVRLFWRSGFDRLTLDQVAAELGVTKPTLCRTLGDKESIFARAVLAYYEEHIRPGEERLEASESLRVGLRGCFALNVERALEEGNPRGCFLTDTTMSGAFTSGAIAETLGRLQAGTRDLLMRKINDAIASGELKASAESGAVLGYVLAQFAALSTLSRTAPSRGQLETVVGYMLDGLPWSDGVP